MEQFSDRVVTNGRNLVTNRYFRLLLVHLQPDIRGLGRVAARLRQGIRGLGRVAARLRQGIRGLGRAAARLRRDIRGLGRVAARLRRGFRGLGIAAGHLRLGLCFLFDTKNMTFCYHYFNVMAMPLFAIPESSLSPVFW